MDKVLVIGLGRTGQHVVEHAMALVESKVLTEIDNAYGFLVFDDGAVMPEEPHVPLFPLTEGETWGAQLNERSAAYSRVKPHESLLGARTFEEASTRAFCDFSFTHAMRRDWLDRLEQFIVNDMKVRSSDTIMVVLTGSLAETACSGLILAVAYWCRCVLEFFGCRVRVEGVWALANGVKALQDPAVREKKLAEGYAALRELRVLSDARAMIGKPLSFEPWTQEDAFVKVGSLVNDVVLFDDTDDAEQLARVIGARLMSTFTERCLREGDPMQPFKVTAAGTRVLKYPAEAMRKHHVFRATAQHISTKWCVPVHGAKPIPMPTATDEELYGFAQRFVAFAEKELKDNVAPLWKDVRTDLQTDDLDVMTSLLFDGSKDRVEGMMTAMQRFVNGIASQDLAPSVSYEVAMEEERFENGTALLKTKELLGELVEFFEVANVSNYRLHRQLKNWFYPEKSNGLLWNMLGSESRLVSPTAAVYLLCKLAIAMRDWLPAESEMEESRAAVNDKNMHTRLQELAAQMDALLLADEAKAEARQSWVELVIQLHENCVTYAAAVCRKLLVEFSAWRCLQLALAIIQTAEEAHGVCLCLQAKAVEAFSTDTVTVLEPTHEDLQRTYAALTVEELPRRELLLPLYDVAQRQGVENVNEDTVAALVTTAAAAVAKRVTEDKRRNPLVELLYAEGQRAKEKNGAEYVRRRIDGLIAETTPHLTLTEAVEKKDFCAISIGMLNELMGFDEDAADPQWSIMFSDDEIWVYKEEGAVPLEKVAALAPDSEAAAAYRRQLAREAAGEDVRPMHLDSRWNALLNE